MRHTLFNFLAYMLGMSCAIVAYTIVVAAVISMVWAVGWFFATLFLVVLGHSIEVPLHLGVYASVPIAFCYVVFCIITGIISGK